MSDLAEVFVALGGFFLIGLVTDVVARRLALPRVTLMLLLGFAVGPSALDLLPDDTGAWFPMVASMALVMVGFLLGGRLTAASLRQHGRVVMWVSLTAIAVTVLVVAAGLWLVGIPAELALVLAPIAGATAPAATADVVHELRAEGDFTRTLLGVVAIDDAWALVAFSLTLAALELAGGHAGAGEVLRHGLWEVGGAALVGVAIGVPTAYLTGRIQEGEPTLAEALAAVFLCGGIAIRLEVSFLVASMVLGAVVANLARHHNRPFHAIEGVEWPFMILFFVLAGATVELAALGRVGALAVAAYAVFRFGGRVLGGWAGVAASGAGLSGPGMGLALLPQAGVAMGMALVAAERMPAIGGVLLPTVVASTVVFEVLGPIGTRYALVRAGEAERSH